MPKVLFVHADAGSENGNDVIHFQKGQIANISDSLCKQLLLRGSIKVVPDEPVIEQKKIEAAPENKMMPSANPNKSRGKLGVFKKRKAEAEEAAAATETEQPKEQGDE